MGLVHQRRFWGNTRGLSADLGRGPKQVEKTHSNRLKKYHAERRCQKFRRWGRLAIRGPFRCKHRIKLRKPRPGHQGPRVGACLPGHDLAGNQIACRLVWDELAQDLDIETLERLESLLADYRGTMLLVSRDRTRLNDVATGNDSSRSRVSISRSWTGSTRSSLQAIWLPARLRRGKLAPTLGPWLPGPRFRSFIRCLHRKGPRMASRPHRRKPENRNPERIEPVTKEADPGSVLEGLGDGTNGTNGATQRRFQISRHATRMCFCSKVFLPFVHREENGRLGWFVSLAAWPLTTRLRTFLAATLSVVLLQPVAAGLLNLLRPPSKVRAQAPSVTPEPALVNQAPNEANLGLLDWT